MIRPAPGPAPGPSPERWDAVVIGAGPAGALAARALGQLGRSVLLIDRQAFPRPKVCGCCINRYALATLDAAGLPGLVHGLGARPLRQLRLLAGGRAASVALPRGVALSRQALDAALVQAARDHGVVFRHGVSAKVNQLGTDPNAGHRIDLGRGRSIRARVVVVADGLGGSSLSGLPEFAVRAEPASHLGLGAVTPGPVSAPPCSEGTIAMACGRHGYLGAVLLEDGRVDLAAAISAPAIREAGGPASAAAQVLRDAGQDLHDWPLDALARWRVTPALTRTRPRLTAPGLFVVGDAAGYVEPFTGEGIAWALAGGHAVAPLAHQAVHRWLPAQAQAWTRAYHHRIRRRQAGCRLVAATLRRPRLIRLTVRTLAAAPFLARPLIQRITHPGPPAPGTSPGTSPGTPTPGTSETLSPSSGPPPQGSFV
ncbi:MAG: FAD-dependent monooxygenase [Planctomycetota bacterium]